MMHRRSGVETGGVRTLFRPHPVKCNAHANAATSKKRQVQCCEAPLFLNENCVAEKSTHCLDELSAGSVAVDRQRAPEYRCRMIIVAPLDPPPLIGELTAGPPA
ncbi:MAG TPA: hypothetical protein VHB46_09245 [Burkholderiales bacterium]|nr:hypothetical protein [Burkholderiales bacterium]